jgi:outer membrane protein assembly factor BamB
MIVHQRIIRPMTLLALACLCLPIDARAKDLPTKYGHEFPEMFELQVQWEEFQKNASPPLKVIQTLLEKDAAGNHIVPQSETTFTSVWRTVNRWLREHPETLAALRTSQNTAAPAKLFIAKRSGDSDQLMNVCRTYPWAKVVHELQIETAERTLRNGQAQLAMRWFQDVIERSEDPELRARAQSGYWLAAAHSKDSVDDIHAIFREVEPSARYPWFGQQCSAKEIEATLSAGLKPRQPFPALSALSLRTLQLPEEPPWMGSIPWVNNPSFRKFLYRDKVQPVVSSRGTVVAGPCLVAWYADQSLDAPAWKKIATMDIRERLDDEVPPVPPFSPLVAEGRIFVRCGSDLGPPEKRTRILRSGDGGRGKIYLLENLAAFDQTTGKQVWSTGDDPAWADLFAVNAPVYSDGRLYLLAVLRKSVFPVEGWFVFGQEPIFLVIADAGTGRILQRRELVAHKSRFQPHNPEPGKPNPPQKKHKVPFQVRLSQCFFGNRLSIDRGEIYCPTALGAVARCDARDGLIEWVATYPQINSNWHDVGIMARRHGIAPLVGGGVIVFSPRDSVAIFAVDRATGTQLWQKTQIESESGGKPDKANAVEGPADSEMENASLEALGLFGDSVLVTFGQQIAALDTSTGKVRWSRSLDASVERPVKIVSTTLYLATATDLLQIDGVTGKTLASRSLAPAHIDHGFVFDERGLLIVRPGKHGITSVGVPGPDDKVNKK